MKKFVVSLLPLTLMVLVAALWLGAHPTPSVDDGSAASTWSDPALELEVANPASAPAGDGACTDAKAQIVPGGEQLACCIDQCHRDRDCRAICGKEFGGQCVQVNSCCTECFCFGFAPTSGLPS